MNEQVLSIEQIQELEDLGMNCSQGSMFWHNYNTEDDPQYELCATVDVGDIPTFTLQDILEILPSISHSDEYTNYPILVRASDGVNWYCSYGTNKCEIKGKTPLEVAFRMLKWVLQTTK